MFGVLGPVTGHDVAQSALSGVVPIQVYSSLRGPGNALSQFSKMVQDFSVRGFCGINL